MQGSRESLQAPDTGWDSQCVVPDSGQVARGGWAKAQRCKGSVEPLTPCGPKDPTDPVGSCQVSKETDYTEV